MPATWPPSIHGPRTGRERHIGSPSLVTGSARAKQKHVLRRGGEGREGKGMGSKQQGGRPPLHATHPSHGPPATHNLYLHEIARSCISNTHTKKKLEEPPYAHVICPCVSGWGCRLQVGGRVLISRDDDWRNFLIIAHFLSRCALLAGWLG